MFLCNGVYFRQVCSRSYIRDHVDFVHLGKRVHICQQCDRAFESKSALRYHVKHHGPNPQKTIECGFCKKTFTKMVGLEKHRFKYKQCRPRTDLPF